MFDCIGRCLRMFGNERIINWDIDKESEIL